VDAWRSPQRVRDAHLANQLADVRRCLWSTAARSRFPAPPRSEPRTMPSDDRLGLEDFQCVQNIRSQPIEPSEHQPVDVADGHPLRRSTHQHIELMSKDEDFGLQRRSRPEQSDRRPPDQPEELAHGSDYQPIAGDRQLFWVSGRDTRSSVLCLPQRGAAVFIHNDCYWGFECQTPPGGPSQRSFPSDDAATKLLFLVLNRSEKQWIMPPR
jgi:hypothetical protein